MNFGWLGRARDEQGPQAGELTDQGPSEVDSLRSQLQDLVARLQACEERENRLEGAFDLFNQTITDLKVQLSGVQEALRAEHAARAQGEKALRAQMEVQRPVAEDDWDLPSQPDAPAELGDWTRCAERVLAQLLELAREAPAVVRSSLEANAGEAQDIARTLKSSLKVATQGGAEVSVQMRIPGGARSPVIKKLREQVVEAMQTQCRTPAELQALFERLVPQVVPEVVDVLDASRLQGDPNLPFFRSLEERATALIEVAGLEEIRPAPGSPYRAAEQNVLKAVRSEDAILRDQIQRCVSRGFRYQGALIKKAEVTVYL